MKEREVFSSKFGFILSCVGAALGLGNIWMFSYRLGAYGGAAFLIPYFFFIFVLGTTGLMSEFAFGRAFKGGSLTGLRTIFKEKGLKGGKLLSLIPPVGLVGVFMFYSIVIGWILKYFALSLTGEIAHINTSTYFDTFAGTISSLPWFLLSVTLTLIIVSLGISKGIEKLNKFAMPILFLLFIILTIRSLTLPGAIKGVEYLLTPQWEFLLKPETWVMALGQAFFSVSLNGCGMVVYGSYINEKFDIPSSAFSTAFFDTLAALLASFMIMPAVFAFGLDPAAGPSLLFITLPKVFNAMPYGSFLSTLFFLSIIFAAISSSINMLEGPVEAMVSATHLSRKKSAILIAAVCFIIALPLATNMGFFSSFADFITIIISPLAALLVAVAFFYLWGTDKALVEINRGAKHPVGKWFIPLGKYFFILTTLLVLILGILYGGIG